MTENVDIVNRSLQSIGTRTTVTSAELTNLTSNEAIQANIALTRTRDELLRMAPWDCAGQFLNLALISAVPGTPENSSTPSSQQWARGLPPPPWAYEYQYPNDCLKALYIVPLFTTGYAAAIPITTAVTGGASSMWLGPPQRFKIAIDQFLPVTAAAVVAGGTGYVVGDKITLATGAVTSAPIGAPVVLQVATLSGSAVATVTVVSQIDGAATPQGGSYYSAQSGTIAQGTTTGSGTGATFTLTFGSALVDQRVILTNQETASLFYVKKITDPNVMDPHFQEAWVQYLGAKLAIALTGDKALANFAIARANAIIAEARKSAANEGLTINDITPDFIRARGIYYPTFEIPSNMVYDWGPMLTTY